MINYIGLIGFPLSHSFSIKYFEKKFLKENVTDYQYKNYEISSISRLDELICSEPNLVGFNVTIPYKEQILQYLDFIDPPAKIIGAINTVKIKRENNNYKLYGYNTDIIGIEKDILPLLSRGYDIKALILGYGGAAKAVAFVLKKLSISYQYVSRNNNKGNLTYEDLSEEIIKHNLLIINATPVGMYPNIESCPNIPYECLSKLHIVYDLIYNPEETLFLKNANRYTENVLNGLQLLHNQADASWLIWR